MKTSTGTKRTGSGTVRAACLAAALVAGLQPARATAQDWSLYMDRAARNGDWELVRELIEVAGADVNARLRYSGTVLAEAARSGEKEMVDYLIAKGADVNKGALWWAASFGRVGIVATLVRAGADVNETQGRRHTALMVAARNGQEDVVDFLIGEGADVNAATDDGKTVQTVLMVAAENGQGWAVDSLIANGADVNATTKSGNTALHYMIKFEYGRPRPRHQTERLERVMVSLIEAGADVDAATVRGTTPLMSAAEKGQGWAVDSLIANGADANAENTKGKTALMFASELGDTEIAASLIRAGAEVNATTKSNKETALMHAAGGEHRHGQKDTVALLIRMGADVDAKNVHGKTARTFALERNNVDVAALLGSASRNP